MIRPLALLADLFFFTFIAWLALYGRRFAKWMRRLMGGYCMDCGYNLRGSSGDICSECGESIPAYQRRLAWCKPGSIATH